LDERAGKPICRPLSIETGKENPASPENYDKWIVNLARVERGVSSPGAELFHISS
jgi:hypothetical protein